MRSLLLTRPILEAMRPIEGWLHEDEADLLIAAAAHVLQHLPGSGRIVEVGSYCGRSTVVLGRVVRALQPDASVYAIDPHRGAVGSLDQGLLQYPPTLEKFRRNIEQAGVQEQVKPLICSSWEADWHEPVSMLFIDGLHDYENVSRDFAHFEPWVVEGGLIAFHDYSSQYPGVRRFVDELLNGGRFIALAHVRNLIVVQAG